MEKLQHPDYNSWKDLKEFLENNGMAMQKKFGQNFLLNSDVRKRIVDSLELDETKSVWEVGPGLGCMTEEILSRGAKLTCFEIDHGFAGLVRQFFYDYTEAGKFSLVEGDVLKTWQKELKENGQPQCFFGNLPYNIAATLIASTIENQIRFERCVFTVQKEVAQRMLAKPGSEDYSSFSVLCNWAYEVKNICDIGPSNFWPKPNVDSRSVVFVKRENFPECKNPKVFVKMERALFASRRKNVKNNLTGFLKQYGSPKSRDADADEILSLAGVDPKTRAEDMPVSDLLRLSDFVSDAII